MDPIIKAALDKIGDKLKDTMIDNIKSNGSNNTGKLIDSLVFTSEEISTDLYGIKRQMIDYGLFVDEGIGRNPGNIPPVTPIMEWLQMESISIPSGLTREQFAYAIAINIGKHGTDPKPKPFIQPSINEIKNGYALNELTKAFETVITNNINNLIKK